MYSYWELRILGQKAVFLWFFDKNIIFSGCKGYAEMFSFVYVWIYALDFNSGWCKCVTIERFVIWVKTYVFSTFNKKEDF